MGSKQPIIISTAMICNDNANAAVVLKEILKAFCEGLVSEVVKFALAGYRCVFEGGAYVCDTCDDG